MRTRSLIGALVLAMSALTGQASAVVTRVSLVEEFGFFT
jgi:hypothetical protein